MNSKLKKHKHPSLSSPTTYKKTLKKTTALAASLLLVAGLSACGEGEEEEAVPSGPRLLLDRTLTTLKIGEVREVKVNSDDGEGNAIAFTAMQAGSCVVAQPGTGEVVVTALGGSCSDTVTVTAGERSVSMAVNVIDPSEMHIGSGLLIKYTNTHSNRWDDNGSGGDNDVTFWHPTSGGDGWYPVGSYIRGNYTNVNTSLDAAVVIVKAQPGSNALAAPTGFTLIWNDSGSGADRDGAIYNPICPNGYVALGSVVTSGGDPSTEDIRCVAEALTAPAGVGASVYNDAGTGADANLSVYAVSTPNLPTKTNLGNKAPMTAGTFIGCSGATTSCDRASVNLLLVPLDNYDQGEYMDQARLTGYESLKLGDTLTSSVRIPFTLVPAARDDTDNTNRNVTQTPFYTLSRIERYASLAAFDNQQGGTSFPLTYTAKSTFSQTDTSEFTRSVGLSITVGGGAKFLGSGGEWSATLDTNLSWSNSTSASFGGSVANTVVYQAPPGKFVELVQVETEFQAIDALGIPVGQPVGAGRNVLKYLQYPL